ncbi:Homoserine O-acetyltransferase [Corynebacterium occultum]|uniref:Homoserine O-acetyltransferase n=1 Tax=Corynebacterium occultum TaxID=2675219 RepID=A0A6B8WNG0_9CORY|nr:alpha/beta fold hydrolase [Corynebacterium occultum]QGU07888.1 Homoserine O-acetyltransferase [Corynebacterium occultum]
MYHNDFYTPETQGAYELISIGELQLENGGVIPECELAVTTLGTLNEARDNAILITTWFSGTHQTWLQHYIGPGHALDPGKYFIVIINQIGNGLSTSPHNTSDPAITGSKFPRVSIGDDVVAQERLLREHFGIQQLYAVVGGSMGAEQTYEWAVRFPEKVQRAAPIAGTAQATPHDQLFTRVLAEAITVDPGYADGEYTSNEAVSEGLRRHARVWTLLGLSTEFWKQEYWRSLGFESKEQFISEFFEPLFAAMDPNALLTMAWKWGNGDVARHTDGDLAAALGRIKAKVFVMPINEDMFFPVRDCAAEQALIPGSELRVIEHIAGHFGLFNFDESYMQQVDQHLGELLAS